MDSQPDIMAIANSYQQQAYKVIEDTAVIDAWKSVGAQINLVGSVKMGLLIKKRDIDFHIYTNPFSLKDSFAAIARLAENKRIKDICYTNLLETDEKCIEWHAWYIDGQSNQWQIDMIHILTQSQYAGKFEAVADQIMSMLTDETRKTILEIKNSIPEGERIKGIEIYKAVLKYGIRDYNGMIKWREANPNPGIVDFDI